MAALGLAVAALAGCRGEPEPARNLVLIVIDTLRADRVGSYGAERDTTPGLDAFGREALRFERAYSAAPWTQPAVASIFTGLSPSGHGVQLLGQPLPRSVPTLAERLQGHGFATGAVVSHLLVGGRFGFARGFDHFDQGAAGGHEAISGPRVTERALETLARLEATDSRFFLFVHYFDPHYSYHHHPEVGFAPARVGRVGGGDPIEKLWRVQEDLAPEELLHLSALYDEEVRFTDRALSRLLERLEASGRLADSVVVVTSDHGEELMERSRIGHAATLFDELVRVPLWISLPEREGRVVRAPVSTAGLLATALELLGLPPATRAGLAASFAPRLRGREGPAAPVFSETRHFAQKQAVIDGRYKLVVDLQSGAPELYDVVADPGERRDLAAEQPDRVRRLQALLARHVDEQTGLGISTAAPSLDARQLELLRGLGYVESPE